MKRMPKYFYICTNLTPWHWINEDACLRAWVSALYRAHDYIGSEYWPFTRAKARLRPERIIMQFENKPPYKFIKLVR